MYGLIPFFLIPIFLIWIFYRVFIKKDIRKHRNELYAGLVFMGLWIILFVVFTKL